MRPFSALIFMLMFCFGLMTTVAHAQFSGPAESSLQFGQKNKQLKTVLALQGQLQLLHSLIEHEQAVNQMIEAAVAVGISDPYVPAPDREICSEVPANIPCAQSYETLYANYSAAKKKPAPIVIPMPVISDAKPVEKKIKENKEPEPVVAMSVFWTNITCLNDKCSALISADPTNPKATYRILPGEKLPDGSVINRISATGVTVMRDNKMIQVEPAPKA